MKKQLLLALATTLMVHTPAQAAFISPGIQALGYGVAGYSLPTLLVKNPITKRDTRVNFATLAASSLCLYKGCSLVLDERYRLLALPAASTLALLFCNWNINYETKKEMEEKLKMAEEKIQHLEANAQNAHTHEEQQLAGTELWKKLVKTREELSQAKKENLIALQRAFYAEKRLEQSRKSIEELLEQPSSTTPKSSLQFAE